MKRIIGVIMSLVLLAGAALPTTAQTRRSRYSERVTQSRQYGQYGQYGQSGRYDRGYDTRYNGRRGRYYDNRSFWQKHRDKLTVAAGTGGGALIGGIAGGRKGAVIGALLGAGGSAL